MGLDYRVTGGGLILAEQTMDGAALEAALKRRDPDLRLQGWPSDTHGTIMWKVVRLVGDNRPPETICVWQSADGKPYPLSSGLLDLVDRLDRNTRGLHIDADSLNKLREQNVKRDRESAYHDLADDWSAKHGRPILPRSQSLRLARDKQRNQGKKV